MPSGESHGSAKLYQSDVNEMRRLYKSSTWTQQELADEFGVSQAQVSEIVNNRSWHDPEVRKKTLQARGEQ